MGRAAPSPLLRYGALGVAVFGVSFSAIFIRLAESPALTIAANRMLLAVLLLLPPVLASSARRHLQLLNRQDWIGVLVSGACLALHFGLWTVSLSYTSVASSVIFVSTHPIFVALAELVVFKRRVGVVGSGGIALTMLGSVFVGGGDLRLGGEALYGDVLAVGGALALVGYLIIGRQLRRHMSFLVYSALVYAACWVALSIGAAAAGVSLLGFGPRDLLLFFLLALVSTIGGHTVFNWALRHLPASVIAVAFVGEPAVAALLAWPVLGEPIQMSTALGGALILGGIYLTARGS